jgi:ribonuclease T1
LTPVGDDGRVNRRTLTLIALVAAVLVAGWLLTRTPPTSPSTAARAASAGMSTCPLETLPPEAADTVADIHSDGPFPFPRNDGVVFGNRESHLPAEGKGYYREYTVVTPGASSRSVRRIVTGGSPPTDPREYFYTDDHYNSFCLITGAGGRS